MAWTREGQSAASAPPSFHSEFDFSQILMLRNAGTECTLSNEFGILNLLSLTC